MEIDIPESERSKWVSAFRKKKALKIISLLALFILLLSGATWILFKFFNIDPLGIGKDYTPTVAMKKFENYDELLSFMEDNDTLSANRSSYSSGLGSVNSFNNPITADATEGWGMASAPAGVPSSSWSEDSGEKSDYSTTNVQVAGVDEDDLWKTDGDYVYAVSNRKVLILKAVPADAAEIVATIPLDYAPAGIYLLGDKLAVFGSNYNIKPLAEYDKVNANRNRGYSDLTVYDVSERTRPKKEKQYDFEGSYANSRLIGDYLYFVTMTTPVYAYYDETQPVPYVLEDGAVRAVAAKPDVYYFDAPYVASNFTTLSAINLRDADQDIKNETYVLDGNQNAMYVSENNLYITFSKYTSEQDLMVAAVKELIVPRLGAKDQERIVEIEKAPSYILGAGEKSAKIAAIFEKYYQSLADDDQDKLNEEVKAKMTEKYEAVSREMQKTVVHKIAIDQGQLKYKSAGEVSGRVLNQFAMDESGDGNFRIATTVDTSWSNLSDATTKSYSNLYVLDQDMKKLGEVEDIAPGEKIYAARFMQNRAYLVTFKRTDPLFVIDLNDPKEPQILGELKVPGYSTYLHPYDDSKLIGLGKNADANGVEIDGIKLSLFDVADVSKPQEIDSYILGDYGSSSLALENAKAFLFSREKNLLAIPAVVKKQDGYSKYYNQTVAAGIAVFSVDDSGFDYQGTIDHRTESEKASSNYYGEGALRSLFVGDNLYSLSENFIKVNRIDGLDGIKSLDVKKGVYQNEWSWED